MLMQLYTMKDAIGKMVVLNWCPVMFSLCQLSGSILLTFMYAMPLLLFKILEWGTKIALPETPNSFVLPINFFLFIKLVEHCNNDCICLSIICLLIRGLTIKNLLN